jgi:hypothetical protein
MPHDFQAMATELKNAVRGRLEQTQVAEKLIAGLGAKGCRSPFALDVGADYRRSLDTLAEAYKIIKALADGKAQLIEVGQ